MYSIKHLQYLVAVADEQSFSKAAQACFVTQSTLSLGVQELERQMGVTLFERSRKSIIPTPAGKKAIIHARTILEAQNTLKHDMTVMTDQGTGPLHIGIIPTIAPYFLPAFLPQIEYSFPDADLKISEDTTETILKKISEGDLDLGVLAFPITIGDLESHILFEEDFVLAAPKDMQVERELTLEDLQDHDLLLLRDGHCLKDHVLSACRLPPEKQNRFFEAESLSTLLAMVNQGYGVTLIPKMAIRAGITKPYPNVKTCPFTSPAPTRQVGLIWRRTDFRHDRYRKIDMQNKNEPAKMTA